MMSKNRYIHFVIPDVTAKLLRARMRIEKEDKSVAEEGTLKILNPTGKMHPDDIINLLTDAARERGFKGEALVFKGWPNKQYQVSYWINDQNDFRRRPRKHMWPGTKDLTSH